jgi:hypothetical protein
MLLLQVHGSSKSKKDQRVHSERDLDFLMREEMEVLAIQHVASDDQPCSIQCKVSRLQLACLCVGKMYTPPISSLY